MNDHPLLSLLKWDLLLLHRNRLILLSVVVAGLYVGIFYLLKPLGNLDTVLIVLLFNDPVVTGFIFAGVIFLMEKNQHTLQAVRVSPLSLSFFILSKTLSLSLISLITAVLMTLAAKGVAFLSFHLLSGVFLSAFLFTLCGFFFASYSRTFNHFLLYTIGFLIVMGIPFLSLFDWGWTGFYLLFPSYAAIVLLKASVEQISSWYLLYGYGYLSLWVMGSWFLTLRVIKHHSL
jgi:fluoroquinolone transport system permease protein